MAKPGLQWPRHDLASVFIAGEEEEMPESQFMRAFKVANFTIVEQPPEGARQARVRYSVADITSTVAGDQLKPGNIA